MPASLRERERSKIREESTVLRLQREGADDEENEASGCTAYATHLKVVLKLETILTSEGQ